MGAQRKQTAKPGDWIAQCSPSGQVIPVPHSTRQSGMLNRVVAQNAIPALAIGQSAFEVHASEHVFPLDGSVRQICPALQSVDALHGP